MSEIMNRSGTGNGVALNNQAYDPYAAYANSVASDKLFLAFSKVEYLYGQNKDVLPEGTRMLANVAGLRIGWKCWRGGKVIDERMGLLSEGFQPPKRHELGLFDQSVWEANDKGEIRDPWQLTNELDLIDGEDRQFTFATSSKGGIGAIGKLCAAYGKLYRQMPGKVPMIELGRDSYMHSNKEFGKIYTPLFNIVQWVDEENVSGPASESEEEAPKEEAKPVQTSSGTKKSRF